MLHKIITIIIIIIVKFPLLKKDIKNLPEEERDELLYRLEKQSDNIRSSFAILVAHTLTHLLQSDTTAEVLKALIAEHGLQELTDQIGSKDTIPMIVDKVRKGKYWSFFNYELVASIIKFCKKTELTEELEDYVSEFEVYCQHRVSEVPRGSLNGNQTNNHCFKLKLDDTLIENIDLNRVKKIQYKLQEILKMKPLQLVNVESGCIELTFRYFNKTKLFPLSEGQKIALSEIGFQWLQCGNDEILLKITTPTSASSPYEHTPPQPFSLPAATSSASTPPQQPPSTTAVMRNYSPSYHTPLEQPSSTSTEFAYHTLQILQQPSGFALPQQPSFSIGANFSFDSDSFQGIQVPPGIVAT